MLIIFFAATLRAAHTITHYFRALVDGLRVAA